ncbi:YceI family protein [Seonamhaeicola aphaedonensis]|uniref:Polyisoprenoid-binding protein YceI n=1 Tax=Seonamhaeicola aphaedonensis TaxID=1461338 RepID=A0A3D9H693_9FLAO|nr:YceI family protein [Seonamhaeicola aphaedonensis]RED44982.1 polyisoprenoid-binding protein YceI [Seonamhaeicola aphaedonensis]
MKKRIVTSCVIVSLSIALFSCKDKAKEAETKEAETPTVVEVSSETYTVNTEASTIEWRGFKPTGEHNGTINLANGSFEMTDENIAGGNFTVDMNSIVDLDIPADDEKNAKLVGHLKSADFFDVEKFPTATFEITGIEDKEGKTMLSGNLTLKEKTNNITFPINVSQENDTLSLSSETFTIDRSKWDVRYGSKSFFDNLGDKFINDDIEITVSVKATK